MDLYQPTSFENLRSAWAGPDVAPDASVKYHIADVSSTGWLASLLDAEARDLEPSEVGLVSCHACSLLSDELIRECTQSKVDFALMPCCHGEDSRKGRMMLNTAKMLGISHEMLIDISRLGVIEASPGYKGGMRSIDSSISPQNRILLGLRESEADAEKREQARLASLHRLARKYRHIGVPLGKNKRYIELCSAECPEALQFSKPKPSLQGAVTCCWLAAIRHVMELEGCPAPSRALPCV